MSRFDELLKRPLPSRCDELSNYVYESAEKDGYDDTLIIGFYTDDSLPEILTEETLGEINFKGKIKTAAVDLRTKEGWEKPHVHILNEYVNIAVRLDKPEYFIHPHAKDTFSNNKQKKAFDDFMRSLIYDKSMTKWEYARFIFNNHFGPSGHVIKCDKQPDYTKLS